MIYLALPWLSKQAGRPIAVAVRAFLAAGPASAVPSGTLLFSTRWPSAARMARVPDSMPGAPCYERLGLDEQRGISLGWEDWLDTFLADVLEAPDGPLRAEDIRELGPDRDVVGLGILRAWGWIEAAEGGFPTLPSAPMAELLADLSRQTRRLPSELLALPFPEFVLNYRVILRKLDPDLAARGR